MTESDDSSSVDTQAAGESGLYVGQAVAFFLGEQRYAVPIGRVQEIQQIVAFSEVPGVGSGVVGMVNLRGTVIPAIDFRQVVGSPSQEYTLETPMIICRIGGHLVAVIVDEVQDVVDIPEGCLQAVSSASAGSLKMLGVARMSDGLVYLLDVDGVLGPALSGGW